MRSAGRGPLILALLGIVAVILGIRRYALRDSVPFRDLVTVSAVRNGIDPVLLAAVLQWESRWNPKHVNESDPSYGLGSMKLSTAQDFWSAPVTIALLMVPEFSIELAARFISWLQYDNGIPMPEGISAYNTGAGGYRRGVKPIPVDYSARIMRIMGELRR